MTTLSGRPKFIKSQNLKKMKFNLKKTLVAATLLFGILFSTNVVAQSSCCTKDKAAAAKTACCSSSSQSATSGCTPSACRGAKTKFGEAKVITNLRSNLIDLKADMEQSASPKFDERSYDIHGIIGETDGESLEIIVKEVKLVEDAFVEKLNHKPSEFDLPKNKAKQVRYLNTRIEELKQLL